MRCVQVRRWCTDIRLPEHGELTARYPVKDIIAFKLLVPLLHGGGRARNSEGDVYYRPQTKFVKVMFLHLSVSHSVFKGGGVCLSACSEKPDRSRRPWEQTTPPPLESRHTTPGADTPTHWEETPPFTVDAGRYGQQVGGTQPPGMHTCWY